jgi:hypothetical protein
VNAPSPDVRRTTALQGEKDLSLRIHDGTGYLPDLFVNQQKDNVRDGLITAEADDLPN